MRNKRISIKYRLFAVVLLILVPISILFTIFTSRAISHINMQLAESSRSAAKGFCSSIETEVRDVDGYMNLLWGEDERLQRFSMTEERGESEQIGQELLEDMRAVLETNKTVSILALYSSLTGEEYMAFNEDAGYDKRQKEALKAMLQRLNQDEEQIRQGWFVSEAAQKSVLVRMMKKEQAWICSVIDLQNISRRSQTDFALATPIVFAGKGIPLTSALWLEKTWGMQSPVPLMDPYCFAGNEKQYMAVSVPFMGIHALYGVPYRNNMGTLGWLRIGPLLFAGVAIAVLLAAYIYINIVFFRPLNDLVRTMERIRENDLECRTGHYTSREFALVNETFNSMIDTILGLKIENYEQRLSAQRAELTALRMQIHPHFYLNCLKSVYGMAQSGRYQEIQQMILLLSNHLRYTFNLNHDVVSLRQEVQMCENYIRLKAVGNPEKPQCLIDISPDLLVLEVPPVSLLTMVENCVKHGTVPERALIVKITVNQMVMEDGKLVDIIVEDNGPGFSKEVVEKLNRRHGELQEEDHVGLANVERRFQLLYGENFAISYWNRDGACVELMIRREEISV